MNAETRLSAKGQVVIPKDIRDAKQWTSGTTLEVINRPDGVLLRPLLHGGKRPIREALAEARAILAYKGPRRDESEWDAAISELFRKQP